MPDDIRLAQFLPFDSLKGFKEAIKEKETIIVDKIELSPDLIDIINENLNHLKQFNHVEVIYYKNGKYLKLNGIVTKINAYDKYLQIVKEKIKFSDIYKIEILDNNTQF